MRQVLRKGPDAAAALLDWLRRVTPPSDAGLHPAVPLETVPGAETAATEIEAPTRAGPLG